MKKFVAIGLALCFAGPAIAGEFDPIVAAAGLDVQMCEAQSDERFCIMGGLDYSDITVYDFDVGSATNVSLAFATKLSDSWQLGLGVATTVWGDDVEFNDSTKIVGTLRYSWKGYDTIPSLK